MKKVLSILLMMAATSTMADVRVGAYGMGTENIDGVDLDKPTGGVIVSFDKGLFGADIYSVDDQAGVSARLNLIQSDSFTVSIGAGYQNSVEGQVTDTSDAWGSSTLNVSDKGPTALVEISHKSGVFLRATQSDYQTSSTFVRSHVEMGPSGPYMVIDNTKTVNVDENLRTVMLGYRTSF